MVMYVASKIEHQSSCIPLIYPHMTHHFDHHIQHLESQLFSIEAEDMLKRLYTEDGCIALLA